jgi:tetratricopeptide (TPR) repeat protein
MSTAPLNELVLPQPEAELHRLVGDLVGEKDVERIARLKELFEVHAKLHAVIVTKIYLTAEGTVQSKAVGELMQGLQSPSLGHWVALLRGLATHFQENGFGGSSLAQAAVEHYFRKPDEGRNHPAFVAAGVLAEFLQQKLSKANNQALFDLLVTVRNKLGSGGHGATLSTSDSRRVADAMTDVVTYLVGDSRVFDQWKLVHVDHVSLVKGIPEYDARICMGNIPRRLKFRQADQGEMLGDAELYMLRLADAEDGAVVVQESVSLSPYVLFQTCKETKTDQVFFFNGSRNRTLEFLNYVTGSFFWPPELIEEFLVIEQVIRGEVAGRKIMRMKEKGQSHIPDSAQRKEAASKAEEALGLVHQQDYSLALKVAEEALQINPFCEAATFAKALCWCHNQNFENAIRSFRQAVELQPNSALYNFALAMALAATDQEEPALEYFRVVLRNDSGNLIARKAIDAKDGLAVVLFDREYAQPGGRAAVVLDQVLGYETARDLTLRHWLEALPPWSLIGRLSRRESWRISPAVSSLVGALLIFSAFIFANYPLLSALLKSSNALHREVAWTMLGRFGVISAITFFGFLNPFAFCRVLETYYSRLHKSVLLPTAAFREWYLSEGARMLGARNLVRPTCGTRTINEVFSTRRFFSLAVRAGLDEREPSLMADLKLQLRRVETTERLVRAVESHGSQASDTDENSESETLREIVSLARQCRFFGSAIAERAVRLCDELVFCAKNEKSFVLPWLGLTLVCLPVQYYCAGDAMVNGQVPLTTLGSVPSSLVSGLGFAASPEAQGSFAFGALHLGSPDLGFWVRQFIYFFELFICTWGVFAIISILPFARHVSQLPVRYFVGMPTSLTLRPLSAAFLRFTALMVTFCVLVLLQLWVFRCRAFVPFAADVYVSLCLLGIILYGVLPFAMVYSAQLAQRERRLEEVAVLVERAYGELIKSGNRKAGEDFQERRKLLNDCRRQLPVSPFTPGVFISALLLLLLLGAVGWTYLSGSFVTHFSG